MKKTSLGKDEKVWVPISSFARVYNRDTETIRRWIISGLIVEIGFSIRKELTGRWLIGVPMSEYSSFSLSCSTPVVKTQQTI